MSKKCEKTITVEEAGRRYFGISGPTSYAAVKRGEIPVIRIGRLLKVPVAAMEELMLQPGSKKAAAE
ncbi:MAG TPA: excisionase family DNA-binding protein [Bradyrhizobium sp.]|jgi:excisionase family DNA binding protein|nr:excisionase family DNA-binding protein [Bradyrhizobium sp.]